MLPNELLEPMGLDWKSEGIEYWTEQKYRFSVTYEKGRYKPSWKGSYLVVGGVYSLDAAKMICLIVLNDRILNQQIPEQAKAA